MIPDRCLDDIISQGYFILSCVGSLVWATHAVEGRERYVLLKYASGRFYILWQ